MVIHPTGPNFNLNIILDPSSPPFQTNDPPALSILSLNCISNVFLLFHFHSDSLKDIIKFSSHQLQKSTVEVRNRFKGLDLIDRVPDELWTELRDCTGDIDQDHPNGKQMQKSKMAV